MNNQFPFDENGDALRNMSAAGDDLTKMRDIDFSLIFPTERNAKRFISDLCNYKWKSAFSEGDTGDWEVTITVYMLPSHATISAMEDLLEEVASSNGGRNDGWGCFAVPLIN